jgi:hypothetical protein
VRTIVVVQRRVLVESWDILLASNNRLWSGGVRMRLTGWARHGCDLRLRDVEGRAGGLGGRDWKLRRGGIAVWVEVRCNARSGSGAEKVRLAEAFRGYGAP